MTTKNIYQKMQEARVLLQNMSLKKSGANTFAKYDFFELSDFIPQVNEIFHELKLYSHITFSETHANLKIINSECPDESLLFTSPMASAELKGCHPVQNLGASQSYLRRYLWMTAMEIVEHDALDATTGKQDKQQDAKKITDNQKKMIRDKVAQLATKMSTSKETIMQKANIKDIDSLSFQQASALIDNLVKWSK